MDDFERILNEALGSAEIQQALRHRPSAPGAEQLRAQARAAATDIAATAGAEYDRYLRLAADAHQPTPSPVQPSAAGRALLPALLAVTLIVAAAATVIFLLLGSVLRLADAQQGLAASLLTVGWGAAVLTMVTGAFAATGLFRTVLQHRKPLHQQISPSPNPEVETARDAWLAALLERGVLPFLHARLRQAHNSISSEPVPRRLGYTSPDFASPDFNGPQNSLHGQ